MFCFTNVLDRGVALRDGECNSPLPCGAGRQTNGLGDLKSASMCQGFHPPGGWIVGLKRDP